MYLPESTLKEIDDKIDVILNIALLECQRMTRNFEQVARL